MLDNGAYEGQTDWKLLVDCIKIYGPAVVALPDYLLQPWEKTHHEAMTFLDRYYDIFPDVKWMYIPQAVKGDIMGYLDGMLRAMEDKRITWLGISRALPLHITQDPLMRVNLVSNIKNRWHGKIHALGMMKGSVGELNLLREAGINSIDSNAPVWRGWCGYNLEESWPEIGVNYESKLEDMCPPGWNSGHPGTDPHTLILGNLELCGVEVTCVR